MPLIIDNQQKMEFWGAKMGDFWPQNESEVSETVFFFDGLKS